MAGVFSRLRELDVYPKLLEDVRVRTFSGAAVSIVALLVMALLFISELKFYLATETADRLYVDVSRGEKLRINFDITFPHIPCSLLSVDAMDMAQSHQLDVSHDVNKQPIDKSGKVIGQIIKHDLGGSLTEADFKIQNTTAVVVKPDPTKVPGYCGPCYGAEDKPGQCCNTCEEVRVAYRTKGWALSALTAIEQCVSSGETQEVLSGELDRGDGCRLDGYLQVNKVAGNFHFAPGKSFQHAHMHIHDLAAFTASRFNVSHRVHSLSFGNPFPGVVNPLDGVYKAVEDGAAMCLYYVKVVPTTYSYISGDTVNTNQFSVTEHQRKVENKPGQGLPGVFFFYDLSPIMVRFTEHRRSLSHFLTQLCAIIGGVFTVAGMIDRAIFFGIKHIEHKLQIGKFV